MSEISTGSASSGLQDRRALLKRLAIGFLPLLLFLLVDSLMGLTAGLIAAITIGILEIFWIYYRERRIDRFVLFDTGLIVALGLVSILLQNDIFFKVKPGLIQLIFLVLIGLTAFSRHPVLIKMTGRFFRDISFTAEQMQQMRQLMRRVFWLITAHTALVFYAAFYMSTEAWVFISGGLFYVLMGSVTIGEFTRQRWKLWRQNQQWKQEEWFDLVEPDGRVIGKAPRSVVHGNPDLLHPTVHLHIVNSMNHIYLQKRADNKDLFAGYWDTAVGGHVNSGEGITSALFREAREELDIELENNFTPIFRYVMKNAHESELIHAFLLRSDGPFSPNSEEISEGRFWKIPEIERQLRQNVFTPNFEHEYQLLRQLIVPQKAKTIDNRMARRNKQRKKK